MDNNCQNCRDQHAPETFEPCKTCVETWARGGERYTKWSIRTLGNKTEERK